MFKEDKSSTRSFPENNVVTHKCEVDWPSRGSPNRFILEANEKTSRLFWAPWKLLPGGPQQAIIWHFMVSELQLKWSTMCHMSKKGRINKTTLDWHIHRCCNMFEQKCRVLLYLKKTGMRRLNAYNNLYQAFWTPLLLPCFFVSLDSRVYSRSNVSPSITRSLQKKQ